MAAKSYRFGAYSVDPARREIHRGSTRLDLPAKVFDCVSYLIEHRDRAVGRDELIAAVWWRADISDNLLAQIVLRARRAFDGGGDAQRHIRTITGFGYRWVYDAEQPAAATPAAPAPIEPAAVAALADTIAPEEAVRGIPKARSRRMFAAALAAVVIVAVIGAYVVTHRPAAQKETSSDLAFVLPAIVHDAPDFAWARLGLMDLVAQRLREAGQSTVPSETVVALSKFAGETPTAAELNEVSAATGAHLFLQPDVTRDRSTWRVTLHRLENAQPTDTYQGEANEIVAATNDAVSRLTSALSLTPQPVEEGSGPAALLAQQVASALLLDRLNDARSLIDSAPAELRLDPRIRLQQAALDFYQSRLPEARAALTKLIAEKTPETSPEFSGRVLLAMASLENRSGNYAESERYADTLVTSTKELNSAIGRNVLGAGLMVRATSRLAQGAYDTATDDFAAARMVLSTTGNVRIVALVDSNFGMMQMQRDRFGEALVSLTKSADYFHKLDAPIRELLNRTKIAGTQLALQDFDAAAAEDLKLAELIGRVEDPEARNAARGIRSEVAVALGRMSDAEAMLQSLFADTSLSDVVRGPALVAASRLAMERGDMAGVRLSARTALDLKWADEQPREYATAWLLLARAERGQSPDNSDDSTARARAWASSSIYPAAGLLVHLLEAEQLAARRQDTPARTAFEQALREASEHEVPADMVEVTTSYAAWLMDKGDLDRALSVLGRNAPWAVSNYRVAVAEARLYQALGNEKLWRMALERAQRTAGERVVPEAAARFDVTDATASAGADEVLGPP